MFKDRKDAGKKLARELIRFKDDNVIVLAIPRGGLPLGVEVAKTLKAPLDIILSKKIGHPFNKEYAIGAVSPDHRILTDTTTVSNEYIKEETKRIREELLRRQQLYYQKVQPKSVKDKTVIIVDDGIATGSTMLSTIEMLHKKKPSRIIVAIPVAPSSALEHIKHSPFLDEVVCLETPYNFRAVGQFYDEFYTVTDERAIRILEESNQNKF